jgi:hypothetical protein
METENTKVVNENILEIQVEAHLQGHDLASSELDEDEKGYEARCQQCGGTVWVGRQGLIYSLLSECCPGEEENLTG